MAAIEFVLTRILWKILKVLIVRMLMVRIFLFGVCSAVFYIFSCELETFSSKQVFLSRVCLICDLKVQLLQLLCGCCISSEALVYLPA